MRIDTLFKFPTAKSVVLALLVALPFVIGCGGNGLTPVSGRVTLDDDPVEGAVVAFIQEGHTPAKGTTDADGRFELQSVDPGDGAPLGPCTVTVTLLKSEPAASSPSNEELDDGASDREVFHYIVPAIYAGPTTTPLSCDVKRGMEPVELKLVSNPEPKTPGN